MATSKSLADKLKFLFATVQPEGCEYTTDDVAEATGLSRSYINYLRSGTRTNPTIEAIQALAGFFGVRQSYLLNGELDDERLRHIEAQVSLFNALQQPGITTLALRAAAADLSANQLETLSAMIDQVRSPQDQATTRQRPTKRNRTARPPQ